MNDKPQKIVFLYLAISITWILLSDYLVEILAFIVGSNSLMLQSGKGIFFVLVTATLLYMAIKKQHKILKHNGEQYKSLFQSNPNPLWIYDSETLQFLEVNDAAIRVYGYSREEFKEMTILDIRPKADHEKLTNFVSLLYDDYNISDDWRHLTKAGEVLFVKVTSHKIEFNNRACSMVMAQDITAKLKQEEDLKLAYRVEKELKEELEQNIELLKQSLESKQRLAEVVDRINNMVLIIDPRGIIIWVNHTFQNFTGYSLEDVVGKTPEFLHGPKTDLSMYSRIMESLHKNSFTTFEILNYTKDGRQYWVELNISAIYNEENEIVRYISIENVITERKLREEKIKLQNEILRKHSWTNSHAIRKPVASILSLISLSKEMTDINEIKEVHSLIEVCSEELDGIIKEIGKEINTYENHSDVDPSFFQD